MTTRRRLLAVCLPTAGLIAGCAGRLTSAPSVPTLGRLSIVNRDPTSHMIHVRFKNDDSLIYSRSFRIEAATDRTPQEASIDDIPTEAAVFEARLDDRAFSERNRRELRAFDSSCLALELSIDRHDDGPYLAVWHSTDADFCSEPPAQTDA